MKHITLILLAGILVFTLTACDTQTPGGSSSSDLDTVSELLESDVASSAAKTTSSTVKATQTTSGTSSTSSKTVSKVMTTTTSSTTKATTKSFCSVTEDDLPPQQVALKVNNTAKGSVTKLNSEKFVIYDYTPGSAFNHGAYINYFNGKFYAVWQNGVAHEDSCGQRTLMSTSTDGKNWTTATPLVDTKKGLFNDVLTSPYGMYNNGNELIIYLYQYEFDPNDLDPDNPTVAKNPDNATKINKNFYYMSTKDGVNFKTSSKNAMVGGGGLRDPLLLPSGRLVWASMTGIGWTDQKNGIDGWTFAGLSGEQIASAMKRGSLSILTEASVYASKDGVLHMLMRSNTPYLWHSTSYDNGETWSDAYKSNFTDGQQKTDFKYLPDGRILYIGTPTAGSVDRLPLMAAVSEDGYSFSKQYIVRDEPYTRQEDGRYKGGHYSYPSAFIHGEYVYVIYAKQKEVIEVTRFKWKDL